VIDEGSMLWFRLRGRRSSMPQTGRLARDEDRRLAFAAAMQQFEEQMTAAKVVTAATRPLNLYYGLVQAGLAITAAHASGKWTWTGHGLRPVNTSADLEQIGVEPVGTKGAFQVVGKASSSTLISKPVSIGAIWQSLPEICDAASLPASDQPHALSITDETALRGGVGGISSNYGYGSYADTFFTGPPAAALDVYQAVPDPSDRRTWLQAQMEQYPSAAGWQEVEYFSFEELDENHFRIHLKWPQPTDQGILHGPELNAIFDRIAPEYRYRNSRYLRPSIEGNGQPPPTPLMTWWLLLYSFSMLARYFPRKWVALLDLDRSPYAVSLQYACEVAVTVVPHLVLEALDHEPMLLSQ
jgi:hypothetical protein